MFDLISQQKKRALKRTAKSCIRFATQPRITEKSLLDHYSGLGLLRGDSVLVHSSLSTAGRIQNGTSGLIESLMAAVGPTGNLLFPTHNWPEVNRGWREFDVRNSPSLVGATSEAFRCRSDVVRSVHPTHSVAAWGADASDFVANHLSCSSPCGFGSPYYKLMKSHAKILLFAVGLGSNTFFHCVESLAECPYLLKSEADSFAITDVDGSVQCVDVRCHCTGYGPSRFTELERDLIDAECLIVQKIGRSRSMLIDATRLHDWLLPKLVVDPHFLLENRAASVTTE